MILAWIGFAVFALVWLTGAWFAQTSDFDSRCTGA